MEKTLGPAAIGIRGRSLPEAIELAHAGGFTSVAFEVREAARLADERGTGHVRELFERAGVRPGFWGLPVAWGQADKRASAMLELPKLAALARELGCPRATTGVSPGSDDRPFRENLSWHVECLGPVTALLRDEGCDLGIEFIGPKTFRARYRHEFIFTLGGLMDLATAIGTGNVGILLDSWHLYTSGGSAADLDRLTAGDVTVVHVNDAPAGVPIEEQVDDVRALPLETGVIDLVGFMGKLREMGYTGPVMPEPFSQRLNDQAAADPLGAAREAGRAMDRLWHASGLT